MSDNKKESPRAWLNVSASQVHETKNPSRKLVSLGLQMPDGSEKLGYTFVGSKMVTEPDYAKEANANRPDNKKKMQVLLSKEKDYEFVTQEGTEKFKGSEIASMNKAYVENHFGKAKDNKDVEKNTPDKSVEVSDVKKESPRAWLSVLNSQVHETENPARKRINLGISTPEGNKMGYTFVGAKMVTEPDYAKASNANRPDNKKKMQVLLSKDKTYDFISYNGDERVVTPIKGEELAARNKEYLNELYADKNVEKAEPTKNEEVKDNISKEDALQQLSSLYEEPSVEAEDDLSFI